MKWFWAFVVLSAMVGGQGKPEMWKIGGTCVYSDGREWLARADGICYRSDAPVLRQPRSVPAVRKTRPDDRYEYSESVMFDKDKRWCRMLPSRNMAMFDCKEKQPTMAYWYCEDQTRAKIESEDHSRAACVLVEE